MKWTSIKNILLGILIVMNVFLIGTLTYKRINGEKIPPVVLTAAVEVLENGGISCDRVLLPDKYISAEKFSAGFFSPAALSRMFFGSQQAFQTDGRALIARKDGAELIVEDELFIYRSGTESVNSTEEQLRSALKALGLNMKNGAYSPEHGIFCCYSGSSPLFGMYIRASLDSNGDICFIEARWPQFYSPSTPEGGITVISHLPQIGEIFGKGTVQRIRFGYSLSRDASTGRYEFVPAWRVTLTDGRSHVFK